MTMFDRIDMLYPDGTASILAVPCGKLYDNVGAYSPFVYGGVMALISAFILATRLKGKRGIVYDK